MGFNKFGMKNFVAESKADAFVSFLEQSRVMTTQCKNCHKISFPPRIDCTICGRSEVDWIQIEGTGKVRTFTTVMFGPAGFENEIPYTLAVVEFPTGIKMFGQIDKKIPIEEIKVGMELRVSPLGLMGEKMTYQFEMP